MWPIRSFLIWSHLLEKSLIENFIFCAVTVSCLYENFVTKDIDTDSLYLHISILSFKHLARSPLKVKSLFK